jgi:hypothetical protein
VRQIAHNVAQHILCQIQYKTCTVEKVGRKFALLKKLPDVNIRQIGEKSPNHVTLPPRYILNNYFSKGWMAIASHTLPLESYFKLCLKNAGLTFYLHA